MGNFYQNNSSSFSVQPWEVIFCVSSSNTQKTVISWVAWHCSTRVTPSVPLVIPILSSGSNHLSITQSGSWCMGSASALRDQQFWGLHQVGGNEKITSQYRSSVLQTRDTGKNTFHLSGSFFCSLVVVHCNGAENIWLLENFYTF